MRVFVDQVGGRFIAELPVQADFLKLVEERVRLPQIVRIAELADQVGGPQQRRILVDLMLVGRGGVGEARVLDCARDPRAVELLDRRQAIEHEQL